MRNAASQKSATGHLLRLCVGLVPVLFLVAPGAESAWAQASSHAQSQSEPGSRDDTKTSTANLTLVMVRDRPTQVVFSFESRLEPKYHFARVLSAVLGCPLDNVDLSPDAEDQNTELYATCNLPLRRTLLTHAGEIQLQPLRDIHKIENNTVLDVYLSMPRYDLVRCDPSPDHMPQNPDSAECVYLLDDASQVPRSLHFEFGYSPAHVIRITCILGFLLLLPITVTFWFRSRASSAPEDARPTVSFAYRRFLSWTAMWGILAWWTAVDVLHADEFAAFLLDSGVWADAFAAWVLPWVLVWIPPALVYFLCLLLSAPLDALRGTMRTQRQNLGQSFWAIARFVFPLALFYIAIAEMFNSPRVGVLLFAAAFAASKLGQRRFMRAHGLELHALTSGDLRDRAFAIAEKAGTKLNQLFVLPTEPIRMANAFAHFAHNIFLTDYLVKNLSKHEVDAVIGHEVAHLQNKHFRRRMIVMFAALLAFVCGLAFLEYRLPHGFPSGPIFNAFLLLALLFMSRRNEFAADAGAVTLTGDAEAMITALAKISRLNTMPMRWGKVDEKLLTHPSTQRRITQLAHTAGFSDARIHELLRQSIAPPADVYPILATALPTGKVFSTKYKSRLAGEYAWTVILTTAALPGIVALAADWARLGGSILLSVYALGFLLTLTAALALTNFLPVRGLQELERLLQEKWGAECATQDDCSGLFVSLAPHSAPRFYEGNWAWDVGFLSLTPELFSYWGEEARFVLRRDAITFLSVGPGPAGWFGNPSLYVSWRDSAGRESTFNIRPLRARSMRDMAARTRLLARDLENWHRGLPSPPEPLLVQTQTGAVERGAPMFGEVTSASPQTLIRGRFLARDFFVNTIVAVGVIIVFGLGFPLLDAPTRSPDSADVTPSWGALYVLAVVWFTRIFLFTPYWLMGRKKISGRPATAAVTPASPL